MESSWGGALAGALCKSSRYLEVRVSGTVEVIPYFSLFLPLLTLLSLGDSHFTGLSIYVHSGKAGFLSKGRLLVILKTCKPFKLMAPASYMSQEL